MQENTRLASLRQSGFTLVEIMVGLAIGLLATIIIIQVLSVFEAQKRTTTGTSDAQTNGSIALYQVGRELQLAGFGLMLAENSPLECTSLTISGVADTTLPNKLTPAVITDGVSDTIMLRYGSSETGGIPIQITMGVPTAFDATVSNNFSCSAGDTAITTSSDGVTCNMTYVTSSVATTVTLAHAVPVADGAELACLDNWNEVTFAVNGGNLQRNGQDIVAGIVNLQAQYGISATANSNQITQWVEPSGTWASPSVADRNRIKAVRIAIVARNQKMEMNDVSSASAVSTWTGSASSPAPAVDLSADADWKRYRYRTFETIIPLRNMIWSKDTL